MTKRLLLISGLLAGAMTAMALPLTPEAALGRLSSDGPRRVAPIAAQAPQLKYTSMAQNGEAALYVFQQPENKGYLVVSADDCAAPLLGYTDSGVFDADAMPPALKYWLEEYARQISFMKEQGVETMAPATRADADFAPIAPMIKTNWDQGNPYNQDCPLYAGYRSYTGCVATSMAQVMNYFKYPEIGQGSIKFTPQSIGKPLVMKFDEQPFDWDHMLPTYTRGNYTEEEAAAVAYLMKAAGYSVQMNYTNNASGALSYRIPGALVDYFKYDAGAVYEARDQYSLSEWEKMIYDNLANVGPVIYDGIAPLQGGHSFICDGYDGNGYFHFNWGWGGMSDGYFMLDALNPLAQGIGGYTSGFAFDQDAVLGIQPPTGEAPVIAPFAAYQYGSLYGSLSKRTLLLCLRDYFDLGWGNPADGEMTFSLGVIVENETDPTQEVQTLKSSNWQNVSLGSNYYVRYYGETSAPKIDLTALDIVNGDRYKFTIASLDENNVEAGWQPLKTIYGFATSLYLTQQGLSYEIENLDAANIAISEPEILTKVYYNCPVKVKATFSNSSDLQISRGVTAVLTDNDGVECFLGDSFMLTLNPGETIEKEWISNFSLTSKGSAVLADTEFNLVFEDLDNYTMYDTAPVKITMAPNPGNPTMTTRISIADTPKDADGIYVVKDHNNIPVELSLVVGRGYFAYPVTAYIMSPDPNRPNYLQSLVSQQFEEIPFLSKDGDAKATLTTTMNFVDPDADQIYYIQAGYANTSWVWLNTNLQFRCDLSGVESVAADAEYPLWFVYNKVENALQIAAPAGIKAINGYYANGVAANLNVEYAGADNALVNLSELGKGILIITAVDGNGESRSIKVAL